MTQTLDAVRATGWDDFLTRTDRALLAHTSWAKTEPFGLGTRPAVLVVDAYYGAVGYPRQPMLTAVQNWPAACGEAGWAAIDRTVPLLTKARSTEVPVVYVTGLAANPNPWNRKSRTRTRAAAREPHPLSIVKEIGPEPGDLILEKCSPSAFTTTPLHLQLQSKGVDTLLVCGEATSGCVRATVVDACVLGYSVGVLSDCCFDRIEASHWMSLFDMDQKYADVVDCDAAISYLSELPT